MKTMKRILTTGLMALMLTTLSFAQDFDTNRMNRDIKIMENILGEMFKTQLITSEGSRSLNGTGTVTINSSNYAFFGGNSSGNVKGTYIPGYGVIFMIPSTSNRFIVRGSNSSSSQQVVFQYSSDDENADRDIDEESVKARIGEFLQDYASTIGQLKSDESILVIYGSTNSNSNVSVFNLRGDRQDDDRPEPLPVISVSAKKSDLDSYRAGQLNADAFQNRLSVSTSQDKERLDLKVLGNIFGTALGEGDGNEFHLVNSNSLSYMYLENFGALYSLNLHRGHGLGSVTARLFPTNYNEQTQADVRVKLEEREKELSKTLEKEFEAVIYRTKEFIIDYGRTLSSLKDDQFLMVSLNISESSDVVPDRVDFQVKKSVFNQLDRGQISREEALNAVTLTEY
jgi:hypothetical protein